MQPSENSCCSKVLSSIIYLSGEMLTEQRRTELEKISAR